MALRSAPEPGSAVGTAAGPARTVATLYQGLRHAGLTREEAGNLAGRLNGIRPVRGGWSVSEIERLRFLRWLIQTERYPDDLASTRRP